METLSPAGILQPGETLEHYEEWSLEDGVTAPDPKDEAALFALFKEKYYSLSEIKYKKMHIFLFGPIQWPLSPLFFP